MGVILAVVLLAIVAVTWRRQNTGARIGAIIAVLLALWFAVALVNSHSAGLMATGVATGFVQLINGIGAFIGMF